MTSRKGWGPLLGRAVPRRLKDAPGRLQRAGADLGSAVGAAATGRPPAIRLLTYAEVLAFFVRCSQAAPPESVGALLRSPQPDGWLVRLFFLDADGNVLPATAAPVLAYVAKQLDDELCAVLRDKDMV